MALFGFRRPRPEDEARQRVEAWARAILVHPPAEANAADALDADTVIKANEILCADPACSGFETVILLLRAGQRSTAFKIAKPLADVTQVDLDIALGGRN